MIYLYKNIITCFIALVICQLVTAQSKKQKMLGIMSKYHSFNMFDGAVLVAENGKLIYKGAFGQANREWNIPNQTNTKFMIGSVSKPLTATLTLLQVQKGIIKLDNTIDEYLPAFKNKPAAKATIRQLLSHTSGIANYDIINDFFPRISRTQFTREQYLKTFIDSALAFAPGTSYAYSSWGYFTLGYILEKATGKTYAQLMQDDIYTPLKMSHSGSYNHTQIVPNRATGYDYSFGGFASADFRDQSNTMGTGDIYTSVEDLFKFHMAIAENKLLNKELTDQMLAPSKMPYGFYGLGWFNRTFKFTDTDSVFANFHLGTTDGFISFLLRVPETNTLVVILCNSKPTDFFGVTKSLLKVIYNKPVTLKEPLHKKLETLITKNGMADALKTYNKLKKDTANYYTDWISMNYMVEQLLQLKRLNDAKLLGESNVLDFPNKDLIMVSMGNVYLALNQNTEAIEYYKKCLGINPNFEEAKTRLRQLGISY
jgi:CubicO group peptidase (beta-lactamase class C family)